MDHVDADDDMEDEWSDDGPAWGEPVDPECRAVLDAFALALTERRTADAAALVLRDIVKKNGGEAAYAERLAHALDDAGGLSFRGAINSPQNDNVWWAELIVAGPDPDESPRRYSGKSINLAMRRTGAWHVDADVLDPDHMPQIDEAEIDYRRIMGFHRYDSLAFVPFGLADWDGPIGIGGSSGEGDRDIKITALSLVHGEVYDRSPSSVTVETSTGSDQLHNALYQLASMMTSSPSESRAQSRERREDEERLAERWRRQPRATMRGVIDGTEQEFVLIRADDESYVAHAKVGDRYVTVTVAATSLPDLRLVSVNDMEQYFDGTVTSMKRMHEQAIVEHGDLELDDEHGRSRGVSIVMIAGADSDVEEMVIDFCLDLTNRLTRLEPREIADVTSSDVTKGDVDDYSNRLKNAMKSRPIIQACWADQPRDTGDGIYTAVVELLFQGGNPLTRWRTIQFSVEDGSPKLRTDLAELAEAGS
ncbi:MAG: hypothetical protein JWM90_2124 [Thermoleophilia bacterium]|nr:hypothetical protein [Thermoleophilia bacterium]